MKPLCVYYNTTFDDPLPSFYRWLACIIDAYLQVKDRYRHISSVSLSLMTITSGWGEKWCYGGSVQVLVWYIINAEMGEKWMPLGTGPSHSNIEIEMAEQTWYILRLVRIVFKSNLPSHKVIEKSFVSETFYFFRKLAMRYAIIFYLFLVFKTKFTVFNKQKFFQGDF